MKLSVNWLREFVDLTGLTNEEIMNKAVKAGFEVEEVIELGYGTNLIVGKVIECHDHPDSDHLHVTKVDIGKEILDIVCGAPNCREGLKVIVAQVGAQLKGGEIKASKIRGVASNGMLCSLLELNIKKEILSENSPSLTGIEELGDEFEIGDTDILKKLGYEDTIFDFSIYANRPDCLSIFAMAKEMAAILDRPCKLPDYEGSANVGNKGKFNLSSESVNCPHFLAKVVNHVVIKGSPKWMKDHLKSVGIKSINNLVDISNYVMLETGQPLHFYDLRSNPNRDIVVKDNLECDYVALDGNTYKIQKGDLMITSNNEPIGIAGIMGGDNTKILEDTTGLIIEAAEFEHAQIRRTANRLGLQTEAAMRFAKGLEPLAQYKAMNRAVQLLIELADASDLEETVEYGKTSYTPYTVEETLSHLNALIGKEYTMDDAVSVLRRLDFAPEVKDADTFIAHIPSYRSTDIKIREDIDEEIIRLTDFDDLQSTLPQMPQTVGKLTRAQSIRKDVRNYLVNAGLTETYNYSLVDDKAIKNSLLPLGKNIEVLSPLTEYRKNIRVSLLSSLLETLQYNLDHGNSDVNIFEVSNVYAQDKYEERLGIVLNGNLQLSSVEHIAVKADFFVLKGLLIQMLDKLGFEKGRIQIVENDIENTILHPYQSAIIKIDNNIIGILGKLHPTFAAESKLKDIYVAELMIDALCNAKSTKIKASIVNKYPSISRDISIVVKDEVKADEMIKLAKKAGGSLVKSVSVFDIYKGEHIEDGYKSVSLSIVYESNEKTLKVDDINEPHKKILDDLNKHYSANLRQ